VQPVYKAEYIIKLSSTLYLFDMSFAYANTLPNTKTVFPPNDRVYQSNAPWATMSGFSVPPSSGGCSSTNASNWNAFAGPSGCSAATMKSNACSYICNNAPDSDACRQCKH
jgi:hypothetical protein